MKWTYLILATVLPWTLLSACGKSEDDGVGGDGDLPGDGDGDGDLPGDGDGDGTSGSSWQGKGEACAELCDAFAECDFAVEDCAADCASTRGPSRIGQEALSACLGTLDCEPGDLAVAGAVACIPGALDDVPLSEEQRQYCTESVAVINECGDGETPSESPLGECEDAIALVADETVEKFNHCAELEGCEAIEKCLVASISTVVDWEALASAESGDGLSPAAFADLLVLAALVGPWESSDLIPTDFGTPGQGGASGN